MRIDALTLFCARLNQAVLSRQLLFKINYSPKVLQFLDSLKENRLIFGYSLSSSTCTNTINYSLTVYLIYYNNLPLFSHLFIYSKKKQLAHFSRVTLTKFQYQAQKSLLSPVLFMYTSRGFLSQYQALQQGLGGRLFVCLQ